MAGQHDPTAPGLTAADPQPGLEPGPRLERSFFAEDVLDVAPALLGTFLTVGPVTVRLTEVEAYAGESDPGSHAFRGPTPRTQVMFGRAGHLYVYFTYGMHWCANVVTGAEGSASAVLLRAGEVVAGEDVAAVRRAGIARRDWTRGPARLATTLGLVGEDCKAPEGTPPQFLVDLEAGWKDGQAALGAAIEQASKQPPPPPPTPKTDEAEQSEYDRRAAERAEERRARESLDAIGPKDGEEEAQGLADDDPAFMSEVIGTSEPAESV